MTRKKRIHKRKKTSEVTTLVNFSKLHSFMHRSLSYVFVEWSMSLFFLANSLKLNYFTSGVSTQKTLVSRTSGPLARLPVVAAMQYVYTQTPTQVIRHKPKVQDWQ